MATVMSAMNSRDWFRHSGFRPLIATRDVSSQYARTGLHTAIYGDSLVLSASRGPAYSFRRALSTHLESLDGDVYHCEQYAEQSNRHGNSLADREHTSDHEQQRNFCHERGRDIQYRADVKPLFSRTLYVSFIAVAPGQKNIVRLTIRKPENVSSGSSHRCWPPPYCVTTSCVSFG